MKFNELKKYLGLFLLAVAVIIVYKTFDNFGIIIDFIKKIFHLLTPFIIGAAIAFVLRGPCKRMEILFHKTKVDFLRKYRRGFAVLSVYLIVLAAIALIMVAIIPQLVSSISKFVEQLPSMLNSVADRINSLGISELQSSKIQDFLVKNVFSLNRIMSVLDPINVDKYAKSVMNVGSVVVDIFLGIIISVYMLLERKHIKRAYRKFAKLYLPDKIRRNTAFYGKAIGSFINRYIGCQLLDACIVFTLCLVALSIMRTDYAALIALMVGSFNLIPYFGAFIAVIISALITLVTNGPMSAIILVVVLIILQQIDANIIQPRLVSSSLSIKPLLVILGVVLGGGLFGIVGMFLGVPLVALCKNILEDITEKKRLAVESAGDTPPAPDDENGE